jgi:hypothetical protein
MPTAYLSAKRASTSVVPLPQKGSSIFPLFGDNDLLAVRQSAESFLLDNHEIHASNKMSQPLENSNLQEWFFHQVLSELYDRNPSFLITDLVAESC